MSPIGCSLEREQRESEAVLLTTSVHVVVLMFVTVTHTCHEKHGKCGSTKTELTPQRSICHDTGFCSAWLIPHVVYV